ncbi:GNAT family N-acetyltransferase [Aestuariivivens sediminis]|uniref:GNAT family N-acetyltransferase n=1 Tax=Aestuariivivens sediminis TaxID=2913557 RepID=UPI001F569480|nr:GNAT family N-acetyltransferase [Aestuariivivens sediminis]
MISINEAISIEDYNVIERLGNIIWREHYIPIVGEAQIDYMLKKFQSANAIANQVASGYSYFLLYYDMIPVGYIAIQKHVDTLFLSKIYVLSRYRGKKIGKTALEFIEVKAKNQRLKTITLTVNKNNCNAINAYKKLGFDNLGSIVTDIGEGFVMDDYKMVKTL